MMGSKISKQKVELSTVSYRFLDTSKMMSTCVPKMMKIFPRPRPWEEEEADLPELVSDPTSSSSLAFLSDENYLLFGMIDFSVFDDIEALREVLLQEYIYGSPIQFGLVRNKSLYQIDIHPLYKIHEILNWSVREISVCSNSEYVAVLAYVTCDTRLQLWQRNSSFNYKCDQIQVNLVDELMIVQSTDSSQSHATCSAFSRDGKWIVLAVCSDFFTTGNETRLEIYTANRNKLRKNQSSSINIEMRMINLEFSSDNKLLAAGSFQAQDSRVFLISTKTWKVIADVGENAERSSSIWGVFNPLSTHQLISLTDLGCLKKWNTSSLYDGTNQSLDETDQMLLTDEVSDHASIASCPKLSADGNLCAVPLSDGCVVILDPNLFQILWTLSCPNFQSELNDSNMPQYLPATSVCFSKSCEYLAVGYSGDVASVWLLPRTHFTLKHLCRSKIIAMCPPHFVHKLPIPKPLKQNLLYQL